MAIDTETMQLIERIVARSLANATSLKGAAGEIAKGVTQYVGARYVPLFAEPLEWDDTKAYEPLTIVLYQGNSYTSRQYVPVGVEIDNDSFWALTGNYNAQVEQYRQEVKSFDGRITANANAIETETTNRAAAVTAEMKRAEGAEQILQANIDTEKNRAEGAEQTLQANIEAEKTRAEGAEQTLHDFAEKANELVKAFKDKKMIVYGDSTAALQPSYMNMFAERMNMNIDNRAISGTAVTPATYSNPTDNSLYALLKNATQSDFAGADYVFLCYSTNDWQGGAKLFDCGDETHHPSFERALSISIEKLLEFNYKMRIIFVSPVFAHRKFNSSEPNINNAGYLLEDYGYVAEHVMHKYGMGFCSLSSIGVNETNYRDWMVDDSGGIFVHYTKELKNNVVDYLIHSFPWQSNPNEYENGNALPMIYPIHAIDTSIYTVLDTTINNDNIVAIKAGKKIYTNPCNLNDGLRLNGYSLNGASHVKIYPEKNPEKFVLLTQHEFGRYSVPLPKMNDVQRLVIENTGNIDIRISHVTVTSKLGNTGDSHIIDITPVDKVLMGGYIEGGVAYLSVIISDASGFSVDKVIGTLDIDFGSEFFQVNEYLKCVNNEIILTKIPTSALSISVCLPLYNVARLKRA